jgi:hypothetical protein
VWVADHPGVISQSGRVVVKIAREFMTRPRGALEDASLGRP